MKLKIGFLLFKMGENSYFQNCFIFAYILLRFSLGQVTVVASSSAEKHVCCFGEKYIINVAAFLYISVYIPLSCT